MTRKEASKLASALRKEFDAKVEMEDVNGKGRYRFGVVAKKFAKLSDLKRQDLIWEFVERVMPRDLILDVSLIIAYTPDELVSID